MADTQPPGSNDIGGRGPSWLLWIGGLVLLALLLFAVFSVGVYMGERDMTRGVVPPWPEPRPSATPAPTLRPLPTQGLWWLGEELRLQAEHILCDRQGMVSVHTWDAEA